MSANFRPETLMELTRRGNVALKCRCGHRGVLNGPQLSKYFFVHQWNGRLHMVGDHLRCSRCGERQPRIRLTGEAPTSTFGPADERGWNELRRKLRG
ncbi:hypothetical protein GCM10022253_17310 [Sphingomonas endophytica]|uniref:Uncharacterized protein n=1 Tax=Sphingomonas endophytica TaxID=869719 RepID=A0ABR6N7C5_9SPHN|nr:hypothetical protein [Sphingomonas endophytica]MBB5726708.1 hypothetical protein [Sphingomonas endophytica]